MKTVFLFLRSREHRSDLLHTKYIQELSSRYKVVVFLSEVGGTDENPNIKYYKNNNIVYIPFREPKGRFWMLFDVYLRNEFIHIFDDNPAIIWRNKRTKNSLRLFFRKFSSFFPKKIFDPNFFFYLEKLFFPEYGRFKKYVKKYHPSLIITSTPGMQPFDVYAILCAKRAKLPVVAVNFGWDNLTVYARHVRKTDYLICWNDVQKKEAEEIHGFAPDNVFVSGAPRFDHYFQTEDEEQKVSREEFLQNKGLDPNLKTVLFGSKTQGIFYRDFLMAFIKWQKEKQIPPVNLFVRIHPLDSLKKYEEFFGLPNIHIERPSASLKQADDKKGQKVEMDKKDFLNIKHTLTFCDLCVNVSSTISVEAMIFDKPVVNIGFVPEFSDILNFYHYRPLVKNSAVKVADNMEEVRQYIKRYLNNPSLEQEGRKKVVERLIEPTDGLSYKRSVDFIDLILKREE